jgi:hypothetical protein
VASLRRQAHGLRPRSHPRTLGRPQGSARSLQKLPLALFFVLLLTVGVRRHPRTPSKSARAICDSVGFALDALTPPYGRHPPRQPQPTATTDKLESSQCASRRLAEAPQGAKIAAERGERSQTEKKIHGAKKHRHNLTPAKPSAAKPLKVVMRSVF